jgi:hypothetical protein
MWIPPSIIFKEVRWDDTLKQDCLPNAVVKLSPKGWINSELLVEWFTFFISSIPPAHPVVLLMDSHASHISPEAVSLVKSNNVFLLTFPAHTTQLLQPLDVGIYKSLKSHWSHEVNKFMRKNATEKSNRTSFHLILSPAFVQSFRAKNIQNTFKKTGIYPFSSDAVPPEALAPSRLTKKSVPLSLQQNSEVPTGPVSQTEDILSLPKISMKSNLKPERKTRDSRAKCHTPPGEPITAPSEPSTSKSNEITVGEKSKKTKKMADED